MSITNYLEDLIAIEDFNVDTVVNGYSISISGKKHDPDNDWDEDPTEYMHLQLVTQDQQELLDVLNHIACLPNGKQK